VIARRILVVDDAPDLRLLDRLVLSAAEYEVSEAASGIEALDVLAEGPEFDAVVLDIQMPGMDGWETLEAIRVNPATASLPVVMCTVKDQARDALRAWQAGADEYLLKPFPIGRLVSVIHDVITRTDDERQHYRAKRVEILSRLPTGGPA
jgi:CheY-like chemotaxis protein